MMTNKDVFEIAMMQSAIDSNCKATDFLYSDNLVVTLQKTENARKYLELPFLCDLTSYGNNIVASVSEEIKQIIINYISKFPIERCFENMNK